MRAVKKSVEKLHNEDKHQKSWGYELWIENDVYCGKILHFNKYGATSLHFHESKTETMYLQTGHLEIYMIDPENATPYVIDLFPGDSVQIPRTHPHQIRAIEDSDLFEFSTTHYEDDSYRITREVLPR